MARLVTVNVDHTMIGDVEYNEGDQVRITNEQFTAFTSAGAFDDDILTDDGNVEDEGDEVFEQGAVVAAAPAITAANPAALTAVAPAAMTAVAAVGAAPDDDEYDALLADVTAVRAEVVKLVTDLTASRAEIVKLVTDITALRTKVEALDTALSGTGKALDDA